MLTSPLCTDFYQLTMAYSYFREGIADEEACFHLSFRKNPFKGQMTIAAGLETAANYILHYRFSSAELEYLYTLRDAENHQYFSRAFIDYLAGLKLKLDIDAVPEGTPVFPLEPLIRVRGPILQCQLLETPLLNIINFQSLIATKAARLCLAAKDSTVVDFGLRRAQGFDGGLSASRAAFIGGCQSTSNTFAGFQYGIPLNGTMAHSFIMRYSNEKEAFEAFAKAMPGNTIFLIDTYNSLKGLKNAILIANAQKEQGHNLAGIRLDSGNLVTLSKKSRVALDKAGFDGAKIVASNELDEYQIMALKKAKAPIDIFGVGTRLVTAFDEPALGGVYKLAAIRKKGEDWRYRIKLSDDRKKSTWPGIFQIRRLERNEQFIGDIIFDEVEGISLEDGLVGMGHDLLVKIFSEGRLVYSFPAIEVLRKRTMELLEKLPKKVKLIKWPKPYPVTIDKVLIDRKNKMEKNIYQ